MPAGVPAGAVIVPSVLVCIPVGTFVHVSVTELVLGFAFPLRVSFANTLLVVPPLAPLGMLKEAPSSLCATISETPTAMVTVAAEQLLLFRFSQICYVSV